jgi:hypothetical protein
MLLWSMMLLDVFSEIGDPKCKSHPYVAIEEEDEQNQQASNDNHGHVVREIEPYTTASTAAANVNTANKVF